MQWRLLPGNVAGVRLMLINNNFIMKAKRNKLWQKMAANKLQEAFNIMKHSTKTPEDREWCINRGTELAILTHRLSCK